MDETLDHSRCIVASVGRRDVDPQKNSKSRYSGKRVRYRYLGYFGAGSLSLMKVFDEKKEVFAGI